MTELWKPIVGYEELYSVSNMGRVKRIAPANNYKPGHIMSTYVGNHGYPVVPLRKNKKRKWYLVHRLIAAAFLGASTLEVNHKNGFRTCSRLSNLEYVTHRENAIHARDVLHAIPVGEKCHNAKLSERDVLDIKIAYLSGELNKTEIAKEFGVSQATVTFIIQGKRWAHLLEKHYSVLRESYEGFLRGLDTEFGQDQLPLEQAS